MGRQGNRAKGQERRVHLESYPGEGRVGREPLQTAVGKRGRVKAQRLSSAFSRTPHTFLVF